MQRHIGADFGTVQCGNRVDNICFSSQGRMANTLEALAKQKESINKQKNDLIARERQNIAEKTVHITHLHEDVNTLSDTTAQRIQ